MRHVPRLVMFVLLALAVRAASGQRPAPTPGERGDPYAPGTAATQVQALYPTPGPVAQAPPSQYPAPAYSPPPQPQFTSQPAPPQQPQPQPQPAGPPAAALVNFSAAPAVQASGNLFEASQIVAIVGNQYILYGDVAPIVNQIMEPIAKKVTKKAEADELEAARPNLTRQVVQQMVRSKLMYMEFERTIEKNAKDQKKLREIRTDMAKRMQESFDKELVEMREKVATAKPSQIQELMQRDPIMPRVAVLMRDNQVETLGELDVLLRRYGSSLEKQVRAYGEDRLGRQMVGKHLNVKHEVTHQEMLNYYRDHADDFALSAKAKFEILTVKFAGFPDKSLAYNMIAQMGNEVYFGAPFAAIARKHSQEPGAKNGGLYDWTTQGSLASEVIDRAIFSLEVGKLSQIIEDTTGYHIVRVIERREAGQVDFVEAQPTIKKAIEQQRREAEYVKYFEKLRTGTPVWTIYDDENAALAQKAAATQQR